MRLKNLSGNSVRLVAFITGLWIALAFSPSALSESSNNTYNNDQILPGQPMRYNPLKSNASSDKSPSFLSSSDRDMDNESLFRSAEQLRTTEMSAEQRALNYQWLQQHQGDSKAQVGSRVFQALMRMGFKTYWEGTRINIEPDNHSHPDSDGNGMVTEDIDYKIRISGDKVKLSFEYDF